ncbi:alpha/beta fold hydrolase [Mycobacterium sp.]|uniref:alpha/beta fold hydrolase n=1 Tax=Mycobacterium sp. TaxID=1785 RepID=UPI003F9D3D77
MGAREVMPDLVGESRPHTYERGGLSLGYSVVGDGQPILFVHGATATGEFEWGRLAAALASDYQCVLPDLRGHGRSQFRESPDMGQAICADLGHLIEHLGLDHPHIVGFSYGSEISLMLELSAPGTARSLVMVSPGTGRPSDYRAPRLEHLYRTWPFALRRLHETHHGPEHWRQLVTALHVDSVGRPELSTEALGGVGCPVLMVAGALDESTRRAQGRRFAEVNALARYVELDGAAHAVHHKCPDRFAEVISAFLTEVDSERAGSRGATEDS